MKFESYTPSPEEIKKAEEMLTPEMALQSEIREKNKVQYGEIFGVNDQRILKDEDVERRPCTPKEKIELDKKLEELGDLFQDADIFWQLDGSLNISLYKGEYIGVHKDVDISFDAKEIEKVEAFLAKKGYGFFASALDRKRQQRRYERLSPRDFTKSSYLGMTISIDEEGRIRDDSNISHLDTHIIFWNDDDLPMGGHRRQYPKEWHQPKVIEFHGRKINCSHPSIVAYFKLFHERGYDTNDLKLLATSGVLSVEDVDLIDQTFENHFKKDKEMIKSFVDRIFSNVENEKDKEKILAIFMDDEVVRKFTPPEKLEINRKYFSDFAEYILSLQTRTKDIFFEYLFKSTRAQQQISLKNMRIAMMRGIIIKNINNESGSTKNF